MIHISSRLKRDSVTTSTFLISGTGRKGLAVPLTLLINCYTIYFVIVTSKNFSKCLHSQQRTFENTIEDRGTIRSPVIWRTPVINIEWNQWQLNFCNVINLQTWLISTFSVHL